MKSTFKNPVTLAARFAALVCLSSALSFAESRNLEIRFCAPNAKTKSFAVVLPDGLSFQLDDEGNAKAVELIRQSSKQSVFTVAVTGEKIQNTVKVESISKLTTSERAVGQVDNLRGVANPAGRLP